MSSELVQSPTNSPSPSVENTTNTNVTSNVVESNEPKPKLTLNAQYEHGLRHGSFQRYREYCERKIRRVRVTSKQTHSKRFQKQKQLNFENVLSLEILLFQAERAWSMAMELKEYVASNARSKFHLRRRMDKAAKWSCLLLEATRSYADARTALEAEGYATWLKGLSHLEHERWREALEQLFVARRIFEPFAKVGDYEQQEVFRQQIEQTDASIRYCNYHLGSNADEVKKLIIKDSSDPLSAKLENLLIESRKQVSTITEIKWRNKFISIKSEKTRQLLLAVQDTIAEIEQQTDLENKFELYLKLFNCYGDIIDQIRTEIKAEIKGDKSKSTKDEAREANLVAIEQYAQYHKVCKTIERNLLLVDSVRRKLPGEFDASEGAPKKLAKPEELVKLYDNLLQNMTDLSQLIDKEDLESVKETAARTLTFKAFRCFYVALSYSTAGKYGEAMGLFDLCLKRIRTAQQHLRDCKTLNESDLADLLALETRVKGEKCIMQAQAHLSQQENQELWSLKKYESGLLSNLDVYDTSVIERKQLFEFPPEFLAVPHKPFLFDLALISLDYPSLDGRVAAKKSIWNFWR